MPKRKKIINAVASLQNREIWSYPFEGPWIVLTYRSTTVWSLKSSQATSSGGKSLLLPSPYSFKLALIDALIRTGKISEGIELFEILKARPMRICPPAYAVVSSTFVKVQKLERSNTREEKAFGIYSPSVAFREYVYFTGNNNEPFFRIAINMTGIDYRQRELLSKAALSCMYSGKRGSFFQFIPANSVDGFHDLEEIPSHAPYSLPSSIWQGTNSEWILGTIQQLDELSSAAKWENVNTYGTGKVVAVSETAWQDRGKNADRVSVHTLIPYRLLGTSKGYTYYWRTDLI